MKLLAAEEVKKESNRSDEERKERVRKLIEEEATVTKRLNDILEKEKVEKKRIADERAVDDGQLAVKKSVLAQEVESLEARKAEALKPIDEKRKEAEKLLADANTAWSDIGKIRAALDERDLSLRERAEAIVDRDEESVERAKNLDGREIGVASAENEVKKSTENLSKSWIEYHKQVHDKTAELDSRELRLVASEKANDTFRATLDKREAELMQPVELKMREAEKAIEANNLLSIDLNRRSDEMTEKEQAVKGLDVIYRDKFDGLQKREKKIADDENEISDRFIELQKTESLILKSLDQKRVELDERDSDLKARERQVSFKEDANDRTRKSLETQQQEARDTVQAMALKEDLVIRRENTVSTKEQSLKLRESTVEQSEKNSAAKAKDLDMREEKLLAIEKNVEAIAKGIKADRESFDKEMATGRAELAKREKEVSDGMKANAAIKANLDEVQKQQDNDRVAIRDGYESLARAREEILGRKV